MSWFRVDIAMNHALPPGSSPRVAHQLGLTERGRRALDDGLTRGSIRATLQALADGPLTPATLSRTCKAPSASALRETRRLPSGSCEKRSRAAWRSTPASGISGSRLPPWT